MISGIRPYFRRPQLLLSHRRSLANILFGTLCPELRTIVIDLLIIITGHLFHLIIHGTSRCITRYLLIIRQAAGTRTMVPFDCQVAEIDLLLLI